MEYVLFFLAFIFLVIAIISIYLKHYTVFTYMLKEQEISKQIDSEIQFKEKEVILAKQTKKVAFVSSPKHNEYVRSIDENISELIRKYEALKADYQAAIRSVDANPFSFHDIKLPSYYYWEKRETDFTGNDEQIRKMYGAFKKLCLIRRPSIVLLDKVEFIRKIYVTSLASYEYYKTVFDNYLLERKDNVKKQYNDAISEIDKQLNRLESAVSSQLFSAHFADDIKPFEKPDFIELSVSELDRFDLIPLIVGVKNRYHNQIDVDTFALCSIKNNYYFYKKMMVIDNAEGLSILDYSDLKCSIYQSSITRSGNKGYFNWEGSVLELSSRSNSVKLRFASEDEKFFRWLVTCMELSREKKDYTQKDVVERIQLNLKKKQDAIEKEKARQEKEEEDRRNRPDYYYALDWVEEQKEKINEARRCAFMQTDLIQQTKLLTKSYDIIRKIIKELERKQMNASGDELQVYEDFSRYLSEYL